MLTPPKNIHKDAEKAFVYSQKDEIYRVFGFSELYILFVLLTAYSALLLKAI